MNGERVERRLAAILAADVVGYSRLMGQDEAGTLRRFKELRRGLIDPKIGEHRGRIFKTTGDGILVEFPSVVEAVACAVAVQRAVAEQNAGSPAAERLAFRIGINVGDVIIDGDDIHGDGVNIAARLEGLAESGGICVSASVYDQVRGRVDCPFDDLGEQTLKNIARSVRIYRVGWNAEPARLLPTADTTKEVAVQGIELLIPDKPSIAVLPFQNMSGNPEQDYFVDGMVEEIITALSRIHWLFVIARNSSFTYKGQAVDVKRVGHELGVRYVLEGSVRKAGDRVRITGQLIDAETGAHLWADRFDGSLEDVFELQDRVASSVAGVIEPTLQLAETKRSAERPTANLTAYDLYLRALPEYLSFERERLLRARDLFAAAAQQDPSYGLALVHSASCRHFLDISGWVDDQEANQREAIDLARRALRVSPDDPIVLGIAGIVRAYFGEDLETSLALVDRALQLNPSFARGWFFSGMMRLWWGEPDVAIAHFERSMRLSPRDPYRPRCLTGIGMAQFSKRQFDDAIGNLVLSLEQLPGYASTYWVLAAAYAHVGRLEAARAVITRLRAIAPTATFGMRLAQSRNRGYRELLVSGLQLVMDEPSALQRSTKPSLSLPDKPSIAVLPFQNMSGEPEQEYLVDGMVEEIITALSRIRWLFVIARNSSFTYKGQAIDVKRVGRELGVRYVLEGSVRKSGDRVRITGQLIHAETGAHLWAERYDQRLDDVFALQEDVTRSIVAAIAPQVEVAEIAYAGRFSVNNAAAQLTWRAQGLFYEALQKGQPLLMSEAITTAQQAIASDPRWLAAYSVLGWAHGMCHLFRWGPEPEKALEAAWSAAGRMLEIDALDDRTLGLSGFVRVRRGEPERAIADLRRAIEINPNSANAFSLLAFAEAAAGLRQEAREHGSLALRLSPRDFWITGNAQLALAMASYCERDYEEALRWAELAMQSAPRTGPIRHAIIIACCARAGDQRRAAQERTVLDGFAPDFIPSLFRGENRVFTHTDDMENLLSGLRLALSKTG